VLRSVGKAIGPPGSLFFFLACVVLGFVLMYIWPRRKRLGRWWLSSVTAGYLMLALPCVAGLIAGALPAPSRSLNSMSGRLDTIIILEGDNLDGRIDETIRRYSAASARQVWVMADWWTLKTIREAHVPAKRFAVEPNPPTTLDQMTRVRRFLKEDPDAGRTGLVVSRLQAPRLAALATALGMDVTVISAPVDVEPPTSGLGRYLPHYSALSVSRDALYEHAAIAYYRWRKWI
jgi:uncharacterized SAM-binding protein YcdF (DUF218 family)